MSFERELNVDSIFTNFKPHFFTNYAEITSSRSKKRQISIFIENIKIIWQNDLWASAFRKNFLEVITVLMRIKNIKNASTPTRDVILHKKNVFFLAKILQATSS